MKFSITNALLRNIIERNQIVEYTITYEMDLIDITLLLLLLLLLRLLLVLLLTLRKLYRQFQINFLFFNATQKCLS